MTLPTSSTKAATKAALVERLRSRAGLSGVQVSYSWPGKTVKRESIWCGKAAGASNVPTMRSGRKARDEIYLLDVIIEVIIEGDPDGRGQQIADERALALAAEVDGVLADDPRVGTDFLVSAVVENHDLDEGGTLDTGYGARVRMGIRCHARLN